MVEGERSKGSSLDTAHTQSLDKILANGGACDKNMCGRRSSESGFEEPVEKLVSEPLILDRR